jgi:hypothetical protein
MKRYGVALWVLLGVSLAAQGKPTTEVAMIGDAVFVRSEFGINRYLIRKVDLRSKGRGNEVVNFAGARIVSADGDVPFERGFPIAQEQDDATPLKFNGTYIGANHGAFVGIRLPCHNCSKLPGSRWKDAEGTGFEVVSADDESVTIVSDEKGKPGTWSLKLNAAGNLFQVGGVRVLRTENQQRDQVYPSVRRMSVSVGGGLIGALSEKYQPASQVEISEEYKLISPLRGRDQVATVKVRYVLHGLRTDVYTEVKALSTLHSFSMGGVQAGAINFQGGRLEQMVNSGAMLSDWTDRTDSNQSLRVNTDETVASQRTVGGVFTYGQTVGVISATINGQEAPPAHRVDVSAARKLYPIAIEGITLNPGDVVRVKAYRSYWPGEEPIARN